MAKRKPRKPDPPQRADPTKLTPAQCAALLTTEGGIPITAEQIVLDIAAGCPVNESGLTLSVVTYAAWLLKQE